MQAYRAPSPKTTEMSGRLKKIKHHQTKLYLYASVYAPSKKFLLRVLQGCLFNLLISEPTNTICSNLPIMIKLSPSPFQHNIQIPHVQDQHIFKKNIHISEKNCS